jgi:hypothetical protein
LIGRSPCSSNPALKNPDTSSSDLLRNNLEAYFSPSANGYAACFNVSAQLVSDNVTSRRVETRFVCLRRLPPALDPMSCLYLRSLTVTWNVPWQSVATLWIDAQDAVERRQRSCMCRGRRSMQRTAGQRRSAAQTARAAVTSRATTVCACLCPCLCV